MRHSLRIAIVLIGGLAGFGSAAQAQGEPPGRVGRLAFTDGTVSFHDDQQDGWSPALINTPLTSGDAIWTEPGARSEISLAGTRIRLDGGTQLDMLAVDDLQTRLQVDRGRLDIKTYTFDTRTPYQIVTPRGTIALRQQGDYYVEAGSTQDATRLGVRSGAAQIQGLNGRTLTVGPGQVGEIYGDAATPQLRTINGAPPAQPAYWATRDRQINYNLPTQYLSAGVTGYEDLNSYGSWSYDSQYGNVWTPRSVPSGWQPYQNGHWSYVKPWGWTWVDDQPWGYASSHYGRWANSNNRWVWVPPQREVQPVYAPALVAFVGGIELVQALLGGNTSLGSQYSAPVGWFPLAPREAYVPSYTTNRDYYSRINASDRIQAQVLESRWQAAQRREAYIAGQNSVLANQRFATVVPAEVFVRSQPVARAALPVPSAQIAAVPVAPISAPPAPTASLVVVPPATRPDDRPNAPGAAADPKVQAEAKARADAQAKAASALANIPVAKTAVADMPTLGRPAATDKPTAPGPKLATVPNPPSGIAAPSAPTSAPTRPAAVPPLVPRTGAAPPLLKDDKAPPTPAKPEVKPEARPAAVEPSKPAANIAAPAIPATPAAPQNRPQPEVAAPATPATPAAPVAKPEATRLAPQAAPPAPVAPTAPLASPQTGQHPLPPQLQQATPHVTSPPAGAPPQAALPTSQPQQHGKPAQIQPGQAEPKTAAPEPASDPAATDAEQKKKNENENEKK